MKNKFSALLFLSSLILGCGSVNTNNKHNDQVNSDNAKVGNSYEELKVIAENGNQVVQELLLKCYEDSLNGSQTTYRIYKEGKVIYGGVKGASLGAAAAVLVIGVGTGGVGLVVIGACAVAGGIGGGILGGKIGEIIGTGADRSIEWMTQ